MIPNVTTKCTHCGYSIDNDVSSDPPPQCKNVTSYTAPCDARDHTLQMATTHCRVGGSIAFALRRVDSVKLKKMSMKMSTDVQWSPAKQLHEAVRVLTKSTKACQPRAIVEMSAGELMLGGMEFLRPSRHAFGVFESAVL